MAAHLPAVAAVFLTHFDETKGQSVLYYRSYNENKLPSETIEHSSLPSGLHALETDLFSFRHGDLPAVALFRNRADEGSTKRGRRMASLGVVLVDDQVSEDVFAFRPYLSEVFDRIEALDPSPFVAAGSEGAKRVLDQLWDDHGSDPIIHAESSRTDRLRRTTDTSVVLDSLHPLTQLPVLVGRLGPQIMTMYKAALSGRRILIYSQPPLEPVSAYAWCISAMSLPPQGVRATPSEWVGQVGLMDIDSLSKRSGPWVATTSDKILLANTKLYDVSLDLSSPSPEITCTYPPPPRSLSYSFSDIPLYRTLRALASCGPGTGPGPATNDAGEGDWWVTLYELVDKVWAVCAGVCEYAVGRGRVGEIALGLDEDARPLLDDLAGERESDEMALRGRLIMRQLYHNTHHLHARLKEVELGQAAVTSRQARELTGQWVVSSNDVQFWNDLAGHWQDEEER